MSSGGERFVTAGSALVPGVAPVVYLATGAARAEFIETL